MLGKPELFMKLYCDWLQALIGGVGLVLKCVEYEPIHSAFKTSPALPLWAFAASRYDFHE